MRSVGEKAQVQSIPCGKYLLRDKYDDTEYMVHILKGCKVHDKTSHPDGHVTGQGLIGQIKTGMESRFG